MIKLTFLGDVMCKSQIITACKTEGGYNFDLIFENMKEYFSESDYVFANLETPVSFDNRDLTSEEWRFNSPYEFSESVYNSGIDFVATANNHCLDRGIDGITSTIKSLDKVGLAHTGTYLSKENKEPKVVTINGVKLGILSYTYGTNAFSNNEYLNKEEKYMVNMFQNQELSNKALRYIYKNRNAGPFKFLYKFLVKFKIAQFNKPYTNG